MKSTINYSTEQILSYKIQFFSRVASISYAFLPAMNKSFTAAIITLLLGKCCPRSSSFINLNIWKSEVVRFGLYIGCSRTALSGTGNVLHSLQTGMGPGIIVFLEKRCLLRWPDSGSLRIQINQHPDVVVRIDDLHRF